MLHAPPGSFFGLQVNNFDPITTLGTSVIPGASSAEGSWTEVISDTVVTGDLYGISIGVLNGDTSATSKQHLLDIGTDPAGGTSYSAIISNIACGSAGGMGQGGRWFYFPIFIKSGSAIAVRIQGNAATAGTVIVAAAGYGQPDRPELTRAGQYTETIGTVTGSSGVAYTPGNGAWGSYVSLGTTTKDLWWWQVGMQVDDTTMNNQDVLCQLAYGDATNKVTILTAYHRTFAAEQICNPYQLNGFCRVPGGSTIYVRGQASGAPDSNYSALAVGIG